MNDLLVSSILWFHLLNSLEYLALTLHKFTVLASDRFKRCYYIYYSVRIVTKKESNVFLPIMSFHQTSTNCTFQPCKYINDLKQWHESSAFSWYVNKQFRAFLLLIFLIVWESYSVLIKIISFWSVTDFFTTYWLNLTT